MLALAWIIFAVVVVAVVAFAFFWTKYYSDPREVEAITTVVTVVALSVTFLTVFLIPVDIYIASSTQFVGDESDCEGIYFDGHCKLDSSSAEERVSAVKIVYYSEFTSDCSSLLCQPGSQLCCHSLRLLLL